MKGVYLDFIFPVGHRTFSSKIIEYLKSFSNLVVLQEEQYYKDKLDGVNYIEIKYKKISKKRIPASLVDRINSLLVMYYNSRTLNLNNFDYIVVAAYDTVSFAFGNFFYKKKEKMFLYEHMNIDELKNPIKRFFYKTYMNKVNHIVFDDYIKDYMVKEIGVKENLIHVIKHPLRVNKNKKYMKVDYENIISICGLSSSNDDAQILEIINEEKKSKILDNSNLNIILKSKKYNYNSKNLRVINTYLSDLEYEKIIEKSDYSLILLSEGYCYRESGVIIDSLSNNKIVLGNNKEAIINKHKKYPSICKIINNLNDIKLVVQQLKDDDNVACEFNKFIEEHSEENIIKKLKLCLEGDYEKKFN